MTNSVDNEEIQEIKTLQDKIIIPDGNISKTFQLVMPLKEAFCCMMYYGLTGLLGCEACVRRCDRTRCLHCRDEEQFETVSRTIRNSILNIVKDI